MSPISRTGVGGKGCVCAGHSGCSDLLWYPAPFMKSCVQGRGNSISDPIPAQFRAVSGNQRLIPFLLRLLRNSCLY